jgi:hypothetical protein
MVIEIDGDHQSLTAPERLADALLEALDVIQTTVSVRPRGMSAGSGPEPALPDSGSREVCRYPAVQPAAQARSCLP